MRSRVWAVFGLLGFVLAAVAIFSGVFALIDGKARRDTIAIGSKADTEGILLGEIMSQLIERRTHLHVERRLDLGGTQICFQALDRGAIDVYPEYTGTGLMAILDRPAATDPGRVLATVRRDFFKRWSLVWLPPLAFNNTYALAVRRTTAQRLGMRRISDLAGHPELRAGFTAEFLARRDGYPGLEQRYGIHFRDAPRSMEAGLMYRALAGKAVDVISAYATDGRIDKLGLVVLRDDRHFFPPYQAAPLIRHDTLLAHPELKRVLEVLGGRIDDARMRRMNAEVDIQGRSPEQVARAFVATLPE